MSPASPCLTPASICCRRCSTPHHTVLYRTPPPLPSPLTTAAVLSPLRLLLLLLSMPLSVSHLTTHRLTVTGNDWIGDEGVKSLSEALKINKTLTILNLSRALL